MIARFMFFYKLGATAGKGMTSGVALSVRGWGDARGLVMQGLQEWALGFGTLGRDVVGVRGRGKLRAERGEEPAGPRRWASVGVGRRRAGAWEGKEEGWARGEEVGRGEENKGRGTGRGLGWFAGLGWVELLFLFLFLILNNSNLFEFKSNLNPTLALKQKEPCTSMNASTKLNLKKIKY